MNRLVLAVAGARKTQGIVDACVNAGNNRRLLIVAYTTASQEALEKRIRAASPLNPNIEIIGWYAFLLQHFVRPYLLLLFPGRVLRGFNFEGDPGIYAVGTSRFLDSDDRAYQKHLASLAYQVADASGGSVIDRLERIYTDIYLDEAQDVGGWSLEILALLFKSKISIHLVGDMRQALLSTDARDNKNKQYKFDKVLAWYQNHEQAGRLTIERQSTTYRSVQLIASLSDRVFDQSLGYPATQSDVAIDQSVHSGLFLVSPIDVAIYAQRFNPLCLHWRDGLGSHLGLPFVTFGVAKGATADHVLIFPTSKFLTFLRNETPLNGKTACAFYIGITRARFSVAVVSEESSAGHGFVPWSR